MTMPPYSAFAILLAALLPTTPPAFADPPSTTAPSTPNTAVDTVEALAPIPERFLGTWRRLASGESDKIEILRLTSTHWATAQDGKLVFRERVVGAREDGVLVLSSYGNRHTAEFDLAEDGILTARVTQPLNQFNPHPETKIFRYEPFTEPTELFDLAPYPVGEAKPLDAARADALREEFRRRHALDQEVREVFEQAGGEPTAEDAKRMGEVDRDNTGWLLERIAEFGWIDAERFGADAAETAWLLVQHSGDLRLMTTILPILESRVRATGEGGANFALLFDRVRMWLGDPQRYGSQIGYGADGLFLYPIEDPAGVDTRRAELGMEPLAEYLEHFAERNGGRPVEVRETF